MDACYRAPHRDASKNKDLSESNTERTTQYSQINSLSNFYYYLIIPYYPLYNSVIRQFVPAFLPVYQPYVVTVRSVNMYLLKVLLPLKMISIKEMF